MYTAVDPSYTVKSTNGSAFNRINILITQVRFALSFSEQNNF